MEPCANITLRVGHLEACSSYCLGVASHHANVAGSATGGLGVGAAAGVSACAILHTEKTKPSPRRRLHGAPAEALHQKKAS